MLHRPALIRVYHLRQLVDIATSSVFGPTAPTHSGHSALARQFRVRHSTKDRHSCAQNAQGTPLPDRTALWDVGEDQRVTGRNAVWTCAEHKLDHTLEGYKLGSHSVPLPSL